MTTTTKPQQQSQYERSNLVVENNNKFDLKTTQSTSTTEQTLLHKQQQSQLSNILKAPMRTHMTKDEILELKGFRKIMAQTMNESLTIPHFGYSDEIDVSRLVQLKEQLKEVSKENGVSLSYLPFIVKAASLAIQSYPLINSAISKDLKTITKIANQNIGIAVATPNGLVVPNIKRVQELSIHEIATEIQRLVPLALSNTISQVDLSGTTFTLSNIGSIGGTYASPILVSPQVVIGALGKIQKLPRFDKTGSVIAASIMQVSWSGDHRVIDGATIALFSNLFKNYIENPAQMLLYLK